MVKPVLKMPPEWAPHEATWLIWPSRASHWLYGSAAEFDSVRRTFVRLIDTIAAFEPVRLIVAPGEVKAVPVEVQGRVEIVELPVNDAWARDVLPTFVEEVGGDPHGAAGVVGIDWSFNGWGGRFPPWEVDDALAGKLLDKLALKRVRSSLNAEGGAIHVNGNGCFLGTEKTFLGNGRNENWSREAVEAELRRCLGVTDFLWLPFGFSGDDTGGHVDVVAAFGAERLILHAACDPSDESNYRSLAGNRETILAYRDGERKGFDCVKVPTPPPCFHRGQRLTFSYLNFYLINGAVVLPSFGIAMDHRVRDQFREFFPSREIVSVAASALYLGGGGIHCVTQQQIAMEHRR